MCSLPVKIARKGCPFPLDDRIRHGHASARDLSELFTVISAYMRWSLTSPFKKLFRFQPNATQGVKKQIHDGIGGQPGWDTSSHRTPCTQSAHGRARRLMPRRTPCTERADGRARRFETRRRGDLDVTQRAAEVDKLLHSVGLEEFQHTRAGSEIIRGLSSGSKRRLSVASPRGEICLKYVLVR
mmetsp:Transcript_9506/g.38865  ORF Transcript_9506/g.38865 Transcript_9506/m.38865 type:complete len:184 (-) Transcript_9506:2912-3463(-)